MEDYIKGNKEAWEEAFDNRSESFGKDIPGKVAKKDYSFFNKETVDVLKQYDLRGKSIGQFCCNNGRELLSLVNTVNAAEGIGFDIAQNMIDFANTQATELNVPCSFVQQNILEIDDTYKNRFDFILITIGGTCWFKSLYEYFAIAAKCLKKGGNIVINEQHPFTNMLALDGDDEYNSATPKNCVIPYFEHEWKGNDGMSYITGHSYKSKTFTDYTHPISEFMQALCKNGFVVTGFQELDYDIGGGFDFLDHSGFPLSMIIQGNKLR